MQRLVARVGSGPTSVRSLTLSTQAVVEERRTLQEFSDEREARADAARSGQTTGGPPNYPKLLRTMP